MSSVQFSQHNNNKQSPGCATVSLSPTYGSNNDSQSHVSLFNVTNDFFNNASTHS